MPIDAVIFDMDGTLLDSTRAVPSAYLTTFAARGVTHLDVQDVGDRYILGPPINIVRDVLGEESGEEDVRTYHGLLEAAARVAPSSARPLLALGALAERSGLPYEAIRPLKRLVSSTKRSRWRGSSTS